MVPTEPLCLVLDEPTAALDPEAEQLLFDAYRRAAQEVGAAGSVTVPCRTGSRRCAWPT
ncbi:MAG: hypothetical protein R2746_16455 [Acidimicrobiales bacterium]